MAKTGCKNLYGLLLITVCCVMIVFLLGNGVCAAETITNERNAYTQDALKYAYIVGEMNLLEQNISHTTKVQWLSVSPNGKYLLAVSENGIEVYDTEAYSWATMEIDYSGDLYGNLERILSKKSYTEYLEVIWSPNEEYFSFINSTHFFVNGEAAWDLYLGDIKQNQFKVLKTWEGRRLYLGERGAIYQACFSSDSKKLFYSLFGTNENKFNSTCYVVEHDLFTGDERQLFSNEWMDQSQNEFVCNMKGLYQINDGSFLQIAYSNETKEYRLRRVVLRENEWITFSCKIENQALFSVEDISVKGDRYCLVQCIENQDAHTQIRRMKIYELKKDGTLTEIKDEVISNAIFSPDGESILKLIKSSSGYRFFLERIEDGAYAQVIINGMNEYDQGNAIYAMGNNVFSQSFNSGMMWGGGIFLIADREQVRIYMDEMVEDIYSISAPEGYLAISYGTEIVEDFSFCMREDISQLVIPDTVQQIGAYAFSGCINLKEVLLPNSLTVIGSFAFDACEKIHEIKLPTQLECVRTGTFANCESLTTISIPEKVVTIESLAFENCVSLKEISIPASVTSIDSSAFNNCSSDLVIVVEANSYAHRWCEEYGYAYQVKE